MWSYKTGSLPWLWSLKTGFTVLLYLQSMYFAVEVGVML